MFCNTLKDIMAILGCAYTVGVIACVLYIEYDNKFNKRK